MLEQNSFVEGMLPGGVMRQLTDAELAEYRRPFEHAGVDRRPTLTWPREVFGAVETPGSRMLDLDGDVGHVEVEIGNCVLMLFDAKPDWPATPSHLRVYVTDVAAAAVEAGARVVTDPTLLAFGERVARLRDPQGHLWWLHEIVEQVSPDEMAARFADPTAQKHMAYVQASLRTELERAD